MAERYAPEGFIWVCAACGKRSKPDRYGIEGTHSPGWDESCVLNSVLCHEERDVASGQWVAAQLPEPRHD